MFNVSVIVITVCTYFNKMLTSGMFSYHLILPDDVVVTAKLIARITS